MDVREIEDVSAHVRTQEKRLLFGINFRMLSVFVKCFSKCGDLGLICSVVLDVRVFMRTL